MTHHIKSTIRAVLVILLATTALPKAEESEAVTRLKAEKAALEKRLLEINAQIERGSMARGDDVLGMTLADPTEELRKKYGLPADKPQPVIVKVHDRSFFPDNMAPGEGCTFWIVEHPANGFLFQIQKGPRLFPKTVRELAAAIVSCTITPEEYLKLWEDTKTKAREHAQALQDKPEEQKRFLQIAEAKLPEGAAGKHFCRVVYNYPHQKGTMTTSIRMDESDLEQLRALLNK